VAKFPPTYKPQPDEEMALAFRDDDIGPSERAILLVDARTGNHVATLAVIDSTGIHVYLSSLSILRNAGYPTDWTEWTASGRIKVTQE